MNNIMKTLIDDEREIKCIEYDDEYGSFYKVGTTGITKIEAYKEIYGEGWICYFNVWKGEEILARVPAWKVSVYYKV